MDIKGKTVLVTGGALRIGRALSAAFAAAGADVLIHYHRSAAAAEELRQQLPGPGTHRTVKADLSDHAQVVGLLAACGRVDILINNAALFVARPLLTEDAVIAAAQMQVNFLAPLELMKLFAGQPELRSGCIVNFLDQQIVRHPGNTGSYLLAKKALAEATLLAARQFAPALRVNGIAPGPVLPPVYLKNGEGMTRELDNVPLRRAVALDDLTDGCLFLCRNESVTGQILYIDGGQHLS